MTALPAGGFKGRVPKFPLPEVTVYREHIDPDGNKVRIPDKRATEARKARELELWKWAWRTPQAEAWKREPWRHHAVAMWVRTSALCESADATAADKGGLHRFADQIGLTPAGLKENGWAIAADEVTSKRAAKPVEEDEDDPRARLMVVSDGGA